MVIFFILLVSIKIILFVKSNISHSISPLKRNGLSCLKIPWHKFCAKIRFLLHICTTFEPILTQSHKKNGHFLRIVTHSCSIHAESCPSRSRILSRILLEMRSRYGSPHPRCASQDSRASVVSLLRDGNC